MKKLIISIFCLVAAQNTFGHTQEQNIFNALGKIIVYEAAIEGVEEVDGTSNDRKYSPISRLFTEKCKDQIRTQVQSLNSAQLQEFKNFLIANNKLAMGEIVTEGLTALAH